MGFRPPDAQEGKGIGGTRVAHSSLALQFSDEVSDVERKADKQKPDKHRADDSNIIRASGDV